MSTPNINRGYRIASAILKRVAWTFLALVLVVFGLSVCVVNILSPQKLTRITEMAANKMLRNADVTIGNMDFTMRATFPYLTLDIELVLVVSHALDGLPKEQHDALPAYADTLFSLGSFHGGVNVLKLLSYTLDLRDVTFTAPQINIVVAGDGYNNFNVYESSTDTTYTPTPILPEIEINRFRIANPRDFRFYDAVSGSWGTLALRTINVEGIDAPLYTLDFKGNFLASFLEQLDLPRLPFSFDGGIRWNPKKPDYISLEDFKARLSLLNLEVNTKLDFGRDLIVDEADVRLLPVNISDMLAIVPDSVLHEWGMTETLETNATITASFKLTEPFNTSTQTVPIGDASIEIPECYINYGDYKFDLLAFDLKARFDGNDIDRTVVDLDRLEVAGPITHFKLKGSATELASDPLVSGCLKGDIDLKYMPRSLRDLVQGYVAGNIDADIDFELRPSMLAPNSYQRLKVTGGIDGKNLYWLADDTMSLGYVSNMNVRFGTNETLAMADGRRAENLLAARLSVDSVNVLHHQYEIMAKGFKLGLGAANQKRKSDSLAIIPMGGGLKTDWMTLRLLTDSTSVRIREIDGRVDIHPHKGQATRPEIILDLGIRRLSVGNPLARVMVSKSRVHLDAHQLPPSKRKREVTRIADSLKSVHPYLAPDSVYKMAVDYYAHRRKGPRRVHPEKFADSLEIIDWGTSSQLRRILLGWQLSGSMNAERASLFTPRFPVRNRVKNINLTFNNDTIEFTNIALKAGHSDVLASGRVSNLKRGLTSRGYRQPLKLNFNLLSDTIDVNQLASLMFAGAATAEREDLRRTMAGDGPDSDDAFDREIDDIIHDVPDTAIKPLLVPINVEAELKVRANNISYADMMLHDLNGSLLMYDGAINLHNLDATSDFGSVGLSALYSAPTAKDMHFGFGLDVNDFYIDRFLRLVPAIDSIMPLMREISGKVNAQMAATVDIDNHMDLVLPSLSAVVKLEGDSLQLLDAKTYHTLAKWLLFKDKTSNVIPKMSVELLVDSNMMQIYPFVFDFDRYRLGVQGSNTLNMDLDYHVAVLKSPIPFKFGVNISGTPDHLRVRLGRARFNEKTVTTRHAVADTTRINLIEQIESVFRRGVRNSNFAKLEISERPKAGNIDLNADTLTHADSLLFIREGLIPAPPAPPADSLPQKSKRRRK